MKAGWKAPEVFVAKGATDAPTSGASSSGRPTSIPARKYPVIENIYAGPQGSFVPKSFAAFNAMQAQADIGFIVVQIDGMGTNNRSKAFHDVAWKNLKDAGLPGSRALAQGGRREVSLLRHLACRPLRQLGRRPERARRAAVLPGLLQGRGVVCRLPRQPDGQDLVERAVDGMADRPEYAASSNVDNAYRLQGKVLLVVGEMDQNVDPASTYQVVNQLIKHNKDFELLVIPGAGHGPGGAYGEHKRFDFFTRHLLGATADRTGRRSKRATRKSTSSPSS